MSNPPRRSRPKKPATTIDLEAKTIPAVGYPGPVSDASSTSAAASSEATASSEGAASAGSASSTAATKASGLDDAETRVADTASKAAPHPEGSSVLGEPEVVTAMEANAASSDADDARTDEPSSAEAHSGDLKSGEPKSATDAFAGEESLRASGERRPSDIDDTILSAAEPDFVNDDSDPDRHAGPPPPTYDYTTTAPHPEPRGGFGASFGTALLGAILALAVFAGLQYAGFIPAVGGEEEGEAAPAFARIGDVQQVTTDLGALRSEVEQLRSAQAAGGTGAGASQTDLTAVADRVTALEQRSDPRSASGAVNEEAAGAAQETAERAATAADAAKQTADAAKQAADQAGTAAGQSQTTADQARQTAETASQASQTAQQAATTAQQAATNAQASATAASEQIAAFEKRLASIESANRQAGVAIAAASLKASIDRGGPFMAELESFASAAGASPAVDTLRGFAAEGVPSSEALEQEWPGVETAIAAALKPADPNASVGDQILSGLGGLVTSRPVGPAPATAEGPDAALSRLSAAIGSGNLRGWLDEWQALPQPAKDASQAFQAKVDARARTEAIVGETLGNAVKSVGTTG